MTSLPTRNARRQMTLALSLGFIIATAPTRGRVEAQSSSSAAHRLPVTVALVSTLPLNTSMYAAAIIRTPGGAGRDVILLPRANATGLLLDEATRALLHLRGLSGDRPSRYRGRAFRRMEIGIRPPSPTAARDQRSIALAQHVVDRLVDPSAPVQDLPTIGRVPALEFIPPAGRTARHTSKP